ncbi:MAG: L-threonylcarbamoyladenylate synthase [Oscillospiraceae bacterium]|nr:L-threonylcarbamoyladenylate synthase [Oscillospiraceae bacterium]
MVVKTKILSSKDSENIRACADIIKSGGLVAIPTETVYGLGANALDARAVASIFVTKGRESDNPLIAHIADADDVKSLVSEIPEVFEALANKFWPGPLTLVMKKNDTIPYNVTAGLDTVAIRMPNHKVALELIKTCGCPVAAPSANPSGKPSPTKAEHVLYDLDGKISYILDGGECCVGVESTVLDISGETPQILRPGGVTFDELKAILPNVKIYMQSETEELKPRSPGMKYRHYAPKAPMTAILGKPEKTAEYIKSCLCNCKGNKSAALMFSDYAFDHPNVITFGSSDNYEMQANRLYDALRMFDDMDITEIYAQVPDEQGLGHAIANRMKKAAGDRAVDLTSVL